ELGYTVIPAANGREALQLIEQGQKIDLLFTDMVMPDLTGRQLAELASKRLPQLKLLFTTGYSPNASMRNGILDPVTNFLPKPFPIEELSARMRGVLDSQQ